MITICLEHEHNRVLGILGIIWVVRVKGKAREGIPLFANSTRKNCIGF